MNSNNKYYVFPPRSSEQLECPPAPSLDEVGGKALSLYATSAAFPVPPGLALTVAFFQHWLKQIKETEAWKKYDDRKSMSTAEEDIVTKEDCDAVKEQCKEILSLNNDQTKSLEQAVQTAFGPKANLTNNLGIVAV